MIKEIMIKLDAVLLGNASDNPRDNLAKISESISFEYPKELIELLIQFKGAIVFNNGARFKPEKKCSLAGADGSLSLEIIYGVADGIHSILKLNTMYEDQIPSSIIIIGGSSGGNQVCIDKTTGEIFFWNHEGVEGIDDLFYIARTFHDFIQMLEVDEQGNLENPSLDDIDFECNF